MLSGEQRQNSDLEFFYKWINELYKGRHQNKFKNVLVIWKELFKEKTEKP